MSHHRYLIHVPKLNGGIGHSLKTFNLGLNIAFFNNLKYLPYSLVRCGDTSMRHGVTSTQVKDFFGLPDEKNTVKNLLGNDKFSLVKLPSRDVVDSFETYFKKVNECIDEYSGNFTIFELESSWNVCNDFSKTTDWFKFHFNLGSNIRLPAKFFNEGRISIAIAIRRGDRLVLSTPRKSDLWFASMTERVTKILLSNGYSLEELEYHIFSVGLSESWWYPEVSVDAKLNNIIDENNKCFLESYFNKDFEKTNGIYFNEKCHPVNLKTLFPFKKVFLHLDGSPLDVFNHYLKAEVLITSSDNGLAMFAHKMRERITYFEEKNLERCVNFSV